MVIRNLYVAGHCKTSSLLNCITKTEVPDFYETHLGIRCRVNFHITQKMKYSFNRNASLRKNATESVGGGLPPGPIAFGFTWYHESITHDYQMMK